MYLRFVCMPVDSDKKRLNYLKHLKYFQVVSPIEKCSSSSKKLLLMGEVRKRKQQRRRKLNNTFPIVPPCVCACVCTFSIPKENTHLMWYIYIYIQEKRHVYIMYLIPTSRSTNPTAAWTWQDWTMMVLGPAVSVSTHSLVRDVTDQYKCCRATK